MARLLACPRGHHWEASDDADGRALGRSTVCPVCGDPTPNPTQAVLPDAVPQAAPSAEPTTSAALPAEACTLPPTPGAPAAAMKCVAIPGYEVLKELGRGGMGVVYQARHIELNRIVALKMILGGACADPADLARFHTEAEAIARLQHPGVVQIYEIGQHQGLPFLSLEFCCGGSLDRQLRGTPLPATEAARLVELVAQAMHAAHVNQIVHRDLKPANILLQSVAGGPSSAVKENTPSGPASLTADHGPRTADFIPKVTDFGIAKRLDVQCGPTARGTILGTPSYMAPEQVAGSGTDVGPATDVYALGAILYELLTGRPPFKAATPLETTVQVLQEEPVPPSKLQSRTPRDLETICLKCLQKLPAKRYASAADLADDLRRFQAGEPIRARPVGTLERIGRWCGRHPLTPIAIATLLFTVGVGAGVRIERHQLQTIGRDTAPSIIAAYDIKASLADMHRYAAEQLLAGAAGTARAAGTAGDTAAAAYELRRLHATDALLDAAANITYGEAERGPLRQLIHLLGTYQRDITRAATLEGKGDRAFLGAHREADRTMQDGLLPAAHALNIANREVLDRACTGRPRATGLAVLCVALGAMALLAVLAFGPRLSEATRWHAALWGSMALSAAFFATALATLWYADACLRSARADAFESIYVLQQARADAFALHGDLIGTLLDPSRAASHEREFSENAAKVLKLPPALSRAALAAALTNGQAPAELDGYLADELRNITFAGERESAIQTVERFADYLDIAGQVRRLATDGKPKDAAALCLGRRPGQATHAFAEFDAALVKTIGINRREFDRTINQGFETLAAIDICNPLVALAVLAVAYFGVHARARRAATA